MARVRFTKNDEGLSCDSPRSFDQLLLRWALNDKEEDALGVLYAKYHERLKRYIAQRIHSRSDADDLAQEVFVRLWETRAHYEIKESVEAYLFTVARNAIALHLRKKNGFTLSLNVLSSVRLYAAFLPAVHAGFIHSAASRLRDCMMLMPAFGRNAIYPSILSSTHLLIHSSKIRVIFDKKLKKQVKTNLIKSKTNPVCENSK